MLEINSLSVMMALLLHQHYHKLVNVFIIVSLLRFHNDDDDFFYILGFIIVDVLLSV